MRKLLAAVLVAGGMALVGAAPASATPAAGLATKQAGVVAPSVVEEVRWKRRHHRRHRGLYFGFGYPGYYGGYYGRPRFYGHRRHSYGSYYGRRHYGHRRGYRRW